MRVGVGVGASAPWAALSAVCHLHAATLGVTGGSCPEGLALLPAHLGRCPRLR